MTWISNHIQWASYQIRKIAGCACAGNAGKVFPRHRLQRKPLVSDPGMHHGTCVPHVPWCMSGSLTRGGGENVPGIPGACAPAILRIWQEAHRMMCNVISYPCPRHLLVAHIDRLVQERCNSSALAMELRLSCTNPLVCNHMKMRSYKVICVNKQTTRLNWSQPGNVIWWYRSRSPLPQLMACFLTKPSHYLN